jgi:cobalamin synthase
VLANEVAALAGLASSGGGWIAGATLVVAATVARTLPVLAVQLAPGRVPPDGFGGWFARRVGQVDGVVALVLAASITAVVALAAGSVAVAIGGAVGAIAGLAIAGAIVSLRGQLDGDGLGAIVELTLAPHPSCRRARA